MHFHIITIFPEMFDSYLNESIIKRAREHGSITIDFYNPRDFTIDKHKTVDDEPYGGGPGMVMKAEPILKAVECATEGKDNPRVILLSARGEQFTNKRAEEIRTKHTDVVLISGRYEGIDARVKEILGAEEISIGSYTLTGGELPAMVLIDCMTRRIYGVLGSDKSVEERRVASTSVYTRPEVLEYNGKKYKVPAVLLSGDHKRIDEWRME